MRRRFHRGAGRRPKEPVSWFRQEANVFNASAFGTAFGLTIFDPESVVFGTVDSRITVRRMKLEIFPTFTFTAAVAQGLVLGIGVYMTDAAAPIRDPLLTTEEDQETDWLYLAHLPFAIAAGAGVVTPGDVASSIRGSQHFSWNCPDVRSMRKVDTQQIILLTVNLKRLDAGTFAAPTQSRSGVVLDSSVLYSRTMRR